MIELNAFGSTMLVVWVAVSLGMVGVVITLTVKDIREDLARSREEKAAQKRGFPWAWDK
jgi:hypothetical protein